MNLKKSFSIKKNLFFCLALLFFGCFYPSFYNQFWFGISGAITSLLLAFIWLIFVLMMSDIRHIKFPLKNFTFLLIFSFFYQCFRLYFYSESQAFSLIFELVVIWIGVFLTINSFETRCFMTYFYGWHILMLFSILIGIVFLSMGSYHLVGMEQLGDDFVMVNYGFFFSKSNLNWFIEGDFIRPGGWYDEPGSLAYVIMFLLIYNKLKLKSNKLEYILLYGGLLTLSVAHVITVVIYILFFKVNNKRTVLGLFFFLSLLIGGYLWDPSDGLGLYAKKAIYGRLEDMTKGDDASRDYSAGLEALEDNIWVGESYDNLRSKYPNATAETLPFVLAQNGIIGIIFYFFPIIYIFMTLIKERKLTVTQLKLLFILLLNLGQRPFIYYPIYFLMIYFIWFDTEEKKSNINILYN